MSHETFALINDKDQVVNHIVIDKEDANFESNMAGQLERWSCVRYVETDSETEIILDESDDIWTTHTEEDGFVLPITASTNQPLNREKIEVVKSTLPADSLLLEENADKRPDGWDLLDFVKLI
jgi:hypothetical protein